MLPAGLLHRNGIVRSIAAVAGGTAMAQVVILAFSPLITRIYGPEAFGAQGIFLAIISVLSPLAALRYPMAIVIAEDEAEVRALTRLCFLVSLGVATVVGLVLLVAHGPLLAAFGAQSLGLSVFLLPVALVFVALQDVTNYQAARARAFRLVGLVSVAQAVLVNLARVLGGLVHPSATVLVQVTSLSYGAQALMLRLGLRAAEASPAPQRPERVSVAATAVRHREFPLFRVPADMVSALSQTTPVLLLAMLYSAEIAGLYVLARSVVNLPLNIVGSAVGDVIYSRLAQMHRVGQPLFGFVLRATLLQFLVPGVALLLASFLFPWLFAFVFGESWRVAGEFAQWMSLWIVGMLANIPSVRSLPVIGSQNLHLLFNIALLIAGAGAILAAASLWKDAGASVSLYSIAIALIYGAQIITYLLKVRRHDANRGY